MLKSIFRRKGENNSGNDEIRRDKNSNAAEGMDNKDNLQLGKEMKISPKQMQNYKIPDSIKWNWYIPTLSIASMVGFFAFLSAIVGTLLLILLSQKWIAMNRKVAMAFCILFFILSGGLTWLRITIARNKSLHYTTCTASAKSKEAYKLWETGNVPSYESKDSFFEAKAFLGPTFTVLRDGTVERSDEEDDTHFQNQNISMENQESDNV